MPLALLSLVAVTIPTACSENTSRMHVHLTDSPQDNSASKVAAELLKCPPAKVTPLGPSVPRTGHHKVFLKWNASKPSKRAPAEAVGYCLYRSTTKGAAKENPRCDECEQINTYPVSGTTCVDDLVQDGAIYYYVAAAITQNNEVSISSNEVKVQISAIEQPMGNRPSGFYPSCRAKPAQTPP